MKIKKIGAIIVSILAVFIVAGCSNQSSTPSKENVEINNSETKEEAKTPPILIDDINLDISIKKPNSIGTVYMDAVLTNNTDKPIKFCNITVLLKDKNEKTYLTFTDTIMQKEKSGKTESFAPKTGKKEDIEILKYEFTIRGDDGEDIYLEYDTKLKEYSWN
ncbi:hypothetical protein [Clostridium sardiniense]|uniref:hypothetical protein n=1 Tax=Clostridium sardiniense TaxID=29369 RepID=UPI00195710CA|nr:hypothetical protein [Clostridium sardiniense]MBM7836348.1 PBP1b-binding outer membrane lipoprotein LpoB [Clostridium sardiniense]